MKKADIKKLILVAGVIIIMLVLVVVLIALPQNNKQNTGDTNSDQYLIPESGVPKENWARKIIEEPKGEGVKTVVNYADGYKITVPKETILKSSIHKNEPLQIVFSETPLEISDDSDFPGIGTGYLLRIFVFDNKEELSIHNWISRSEEADMIFEKKFSFEGVKTKKEAGLKTSRKVFADINDLIENSLSIEYVFRKNNGVVYVVSCASMANEYKVLAQECENNIQTFDIIE